MTTLVGTQSDVYQALIALMKLDFDAIAAYDAAIQRLESSTARDRMRVFREDHVRHTHELAKFIRQGGATPPTGADAKGLLTQGKVVIAGLMGDRAILMAMKTNEDDTNTAYERVSSREDLPATLKEVVRSGLADEREHRRWIEEQIAALAK